MVNTANGTVAQRIDYDEFGRVTQNSNPGFQPFGYAGGLYDEQTGLVRFGARDYDPVTGQWTAKEALGFAGGDANLYTYARNDPLSAVDPTGEVPVLAAMALRAAGCALGGALQSMVLQSALNGCVDYGQVGKDALIGVAGCALAGALGRIGRYLDGLSSVRKGLAGEDAVARLIGVPRNAGARAVRIAGTGRGGFRVPDFAPARTIATRGTLVEVKNVQGVLSISPQIRDLVAFARSNNVPLEIFTNAASPSRGELFNLIQRGWVILSRIP